MQINLTPQDFELVSGNDKDLNFTHKDQDGNIVDLTGATISWALSDNEKSKSRIIFYTNPTNITITDATAGKYRVSILSADTEPLTAKDYYHEVRITSSGGKIHTAVIGTVTVRRNIIDT